MTSDNLKKLQNAICVKYGSDFNSPEPDEKIGIALETLSNSPIYGSRVNPGDGTCGWFVWGGEYKNDAEFYKAVHISHIEEIIPMVEKYLALAPGYKFIIDSEGYEDVWFDGSLLLIK